VHCAARRDVASREGNECEQDKDTRECRGVRRFHLEKQTGHQAPKPISEARSRSTSNTRGASRSVEFLGESDEKPFRPADVAEPIRVLIPDYFAYELCAALAKPAKRLVDVVHGEHDAEVA
jgi:hypothetical protein